MSDHDLTWLHEVHPTWDLDKVRVIGSAPDGVFDLPYPLGAPLPGDWWTACTARGRVVAYAWLDATWGGDAEVLLAVDAAHRGEGVGSFVLDRLEREAAHRGLNYVYNTLRETHPDRDALHDWLAGRGYQGSGSQTTMRKRVGADLQRSPVPVAADGARPAPSGPAGGEASYDPVAEGDRGPGHEEAGGYVDVDEHRY